MNKKPLLDRGIKLKKSASLSIIAAGSLWGTMSIFVKNFEAYGFTAMQISAFRVICASVIFIAVALAYDRRLLNIQLRDLPLFVGIGLISVLCLAWTYFRAISYSVSIAAILLYTAPAMVMLMSVVFFKEKLTQRKLIALLCAFIGCVCTVGNPGGTSIQPAGIVFGLLAGFTYATYSIFATALLKKYHPFTVTVMSFTVAAIGAVFVCDLPDMCFKIAAAPDKAPLVLWIIGIGLVTAVMPYLLYTLGLSKTEAGKASVMASVEPLVASAIGIAFYGDELRITTVLGMIFILSAVVILNTGKQAKF